MTDQQARAAPWSADGRSVIGASHVAYGIANQDALAVSPAEGMADSVAVIAVADGHGAAIHYRSAIGAHAAVAAAKETLAALAADPDWMRFADARAMREAGAAILARWRAEMQEHLAGHAPERGEAPGDLTAYGTTLIVAAATGEGVCALQIGDGDLLAGCADGAILRPLPDDAGLFGEQTYSLCQDDAEDHMRVVVLRRDDADIDFVLLATDGVAKSFSDERVFLDLAASWRSLVKENGLGLVAAPLGAWLSRTSEEGSGDDVTLAFMTRGVPAEAAPGELALPRPAAVPRAVSRTRPRRMGRSLVLAFLSAVGAAAVTAGVYVALVP